MWMIPFHNCNFNPQELWSKPVTPIDLQKSEGSEVYIIGEFLKNVKATEDLTYENHINILRDRFIIVDKESIDLFWYKYSVREYPNRLYGKRLRAQRLYHSDWVCLYSGISLISIEESMLKIPINPKE